MHSNFKTAQTTTKSGTPTLRECLELIGMKEASANIYFIPEKKERKTKVLISSN